ncbi:hypothetical protein B0H10DRAFT_9933 [Mycena sp. CBHHK59/15]|nr:hypothetical protein B0H10DRAFT_9933 [Mycena sp. CBHHK59/15]
MSAPPKGIMTGRDSPRAAAGTKTPRKVQWMDTHEEGREGSHALDEHGIDPNPFKTLTTALERHQSSSRARPPRIHYFPPRPAALPRINTAHPADLSEASAHRQTHSAPTTASSDSSPSAPSSPMRAVPGNYIDPQESAGLPGTTDLEDFSQRAASRVVRAHTRKDSFGRRFGFRTKSADERAEYARVHSRSARVDAERYLRGAAPMHPALGGGVLSALLTLYNGPSVPDSDASTPGIEEPPERPWVTPPPSAERQASAAAHVEEIPLMSTSAAPASPPSPEGPIGRSHATVSQSSLAKFHILPHKQRNGGGVLGSLIASTGNISGAAAPVASQLAPNIKRPGYHLSRYEVEDEVPEAPTKAAERPKSMLATSYPSQGVPRTSTMSTMSSLASKRGWTEKLRDLEHATFGGWSTPAQTPSSATDNEEWLDEKQREQGNRREKRRKRKKAEVYITRHVARIIQRQEFILKLARSLMMFGGPSHRLQAQIQSTGHVLDIQVNCMYLPDVVLISFDDTSTGTSNLKFIRQGSALNLDKLNDVYDLYWRVIHDEQSVSEASSALDTLMRKKQAYSGWQLILIGGMCSSSICTVSFSGSFLDALIVFPLGALLVAIQLLSVRNELYANVFEITIATLFSFLAAALASSRIFCYSAVASSSVVLILPGFIVLCGSLEIMSRNIVSGSVRMCYAVVYSLFLGFGLAMGAGAYEKITGHTIVGSTDYTCSIGHPKDGAWYQRTPSLYWGRHLLLPRLYQSLTFALSAFLTVPMYSLFLSMWNHALCRRKEMLLLISISCIGWVTNHFIGKKFPNQSDISAAVGAFAVGVVANVYASFFSGNAFVIMITGILFQLPSGLGNGGLLTYASEQTSGSATSYLSIFQTALKLISVAIGLTVGLGLSLALAHPIQSRRRAGGVFSL